MTAKPYICPVCKSRELYFKHEASYVYSYALDSDAPGTRNAEIFSPFLYDRREQTESQEYVECKKCKSRFQCDFLYDSMYKSDFTFKG